MEKHTTPQKAKPVPRVKTASPATHNAQERCRAVLLVWTERRKPAQLCRELSIPAALLNHWQERALEGMLQALEPRVNLSAGAVLSPRLQALLERKQEVQTKRRGRVIQLEDRLKALQAEEPAAVTQQEQKS